MTYRLDEQTAKKTCVDQTKWYAVSMLPEKNISTGNLVFCLLDAVDLVNPSFSRFQLQCAYWVGLLTKTSDFTYIEREKALIATLCISMAGIHALLTPISFLEARQDLDVIMNTIFKSFRHFDPFGALSEDPLRTSALIQIIEDSFELFAQNPTSTEDLQERIDALSIDTEQKALYLRGSEHSDAKGLFESFLEQRLYEDTGWSNLAINDQDLYDFAHSFILLASINRRQVAPHAFSVAYVSFEIGKILGIPTLTCLRLKVAALFHGLGKLGIPESILDKPKPLSEEDQLTLQNHPFFTFKILKHLEGYRDIVVWASCHHEENDGKDYALQFNTSAVSIEMQILALAEMYTSLKEVRPYREGYPIEDVIATLRNRVNTAYSETLYMTLKQNLGAIEKARSAGEAYGKKLKESLHMPKFTLI